MFTDKNSSAPETEVAGSYSSSVNYTQSSFPETKSASFIRTPLKTTDLLHASPVAIRNGPNDVMITRSWSTSLGSALPCSRQGDFTDVITCSASSSAASSSIVTSDCMTTFGDDDFDDDTLSDSRSETIKRKQLDGASTVTSRAVRRLSSVVRQIVEIATTQVGGCHGTNHMIIEIDRLLRHFVEDQSDGRRQCTPTSASVCELLDEVISYRGLDATLQLVTEAFRRMVDSCSDVDCAVVSRAVELLDAIESLNELLSLDAIPPEMHRDGSTCLVCCGGDVTDETGDVVMSMAKSEIDVQLIPCDEDVILDETTLTRRPSSRRTGRLDRYPGLSNGRGCSTLTAPPLSPRTSFSVRLVGWCLCNDIRYECLHRLLSGPGSCVSDLSLVKSDVASGFLNESPVLAEALRSNSSLLRLNFRLSSLGMGEAAALLGDSLSRHRRLRSLNVAGTGLDDRTVVDLLRGLARNRNLIDLDVGFNDFSTGTGCTALADSLSRAMPPLRRLRMRDDGLSPDSGVDAFFRSVSRNARLRFLDISGNQLGDCGARYLADALIVNRTLREVCIENCRIGFEGCAAIARALRANCSLRSLQLSRNAIGDRGFESIADGLRYNRCVTSVGANQCLVGNAGLQRLLEALEHNVTVTTVKLCYNHIGTATVSSSRRERLRRQRSQPLQQFPLKSVENICQSDVDVIGMARSVPDFIINDVVMETIADVDDNIEDIDISCVSVTSFAAVPNDVGNGENLVNGDAEEEADEMMQIAIYHRLKEALHANAKLKILLWGNRMNGWTGSSG